MQNQQSKYMTTSQKILTGAGALLLLFTLFIIYHATVVVPQNKIEAELQKAEMQIEEERNKEIRRKLDYDKCMSSAYNEYSMDWEAQCKLHNREENCSLEGYLRTDIEETYKEKQERCVVMFK